MLDNFFFKKEKLKINQEKLFEEFKGAFDILNTHSNKDFQYVVVGGFGLNAWNEKDVNLVRSNNTVRDLDIIILKDTNNQIDNVKQKLNTTEIPVSFTEIGNKDSNTSFQLLTSFIKKDESYYIKFKNSEYKIDDDVFAPIKREVNFKNQKAEIYTFQVGTLLHLYLTRIGFLKPKDLKKIKDFAREMSKNKKHTFSEEHKKYKPFHDLAYDMRNKYPVHNLIHQTYQALDEKCNNFISHKVIPEWLIKLLS